jgi:uncharacterized protein (DUF433 family)
MSARNGYNELVNILRMSHIEETGCAMSRNELLSRISINSQICFGKPCIRGRRIWVSLVLDFLASGMAIEEVMKQYNLERDDVLACIAYGAEMARERFVEIPVESSP